MATTPVDPDCMWNCSYCELVDLGVKINDDWNSVGNIKYDTFNDLQGHFL
jgi:hypothetical protein